MSPVKSLKKEEPEILRQVLAEAAFKHEILKLPLGVQNSLGLVTPRASTNSVYIKWS
jgi:hypothetical protein